MSSAGGLTYGMISTLVIAFMFVCFACLVLCTVVPFFQSMYVSLVLYKLINLNSYQQMTAQIQTQVMMVSLSTVYARLSGLFEDSFPP